MVCAACCYVALVFAIVRLTFVSVHPPFFPIVYFSIDNYNVVMVIDTRMLKPCMLFYLIFYLFVCFIFYFLTRTIVKGPTLQKCGFDVCGFLGFFGFFFFFNVVDGFLLFTCLEKGLHILYTR